MKRKEKKTIGHDQIPFFFLFVFDQYLSKSSCIIQKEYLGKKRVSVEG